VPEREKLLKKFLVEIDRLVSGRRYPDTSLRQAQNMSDMASAYALISPRVRGFSENCFPIALSVVMIRLPANARAAVEASGIASRMKTWTARTPDARASFASGVSR
jgi:hypothetical protein